MQIPHNKSMQNLHNVVRVPMAAQSLRCYSAGQCLPPNRSPDPPGNQRHQNPRQQRPKDQQHQQDHQGRDGSALRECLRLISHVAAAGNEGHQRQVSHYSKTPVLVSL
jgi:hypothetical protein